MESALTIPSALPCRAKPLSAHSGASRQAGCALHPESRAPNKAHPGARHARCSCARRSLATQARRRAQEDEDYVELDDEDGWSQGDGGLQPVLRQVWATASRAVDGLVDVAEDYVPENVSRGTVNLAVRAGLLLLLIGFARSLLGVALTVGSIVFGLYVITRVLGIDVGGGGGGGGSSRPRGRGRKRGDGPRVGRKLPSGRAESGGVLDVWFEPKGAADRPEGRGEPGRARRGQW